LPADVPALITSGTTTVDVVMGPRDDWFTSRAAATFLRTGWTVSPMANRIGIRLDGPVLERSVQTELPSEPCVFGSVQVTSGGMPVVLGPDHPVTGGYPVIAVVIDAHLDRLAQLRPGEAVRFRRH
jgi:allophanate hydrolase subunit 2